MVVVKRSLSEEKMKGFLFLILLSFICVTSSQGKRKEKAFWFFRRKHSVPN